MHIKLPKHKCSLYLCHNPHKDVYESAEQYFNTWSNAVFKHEEARSRAIKQDDFWSLQWYPETPIGSVTVFAPTLEECLEFALEYEKDNK